jgi:hypothetical protein
MNETDILVHYCRPFNVNFDDRQLSFKHMRKDMGLCHCHSLENNLTVERPNRGIVTH